MQKKLEELIAKLEAAEGFVRDGKLVNLRSLDAESVAIAKALKAKPDATIKPLLARAVSALERLTAALEDQVATLKAQKNNGKK